MRIASIVGARPEIVQVAVLAPALRRRHEELLVHTGQHYDFVLSGSLFEQLEIPQPDVNLGVGSQPLSAQVGDMMRRLAETLSGAEADLVIVRGDTNSTLAGALVARQLLLPLAHIEAGMRSYDRTAPEELNRVVADHVADLCLVTDESARARLAKEGIDSGVHVCGDVMYDLFLRVRPRAEGALDAALRGLSREPYVVLTLHRTENVDDRRRLRAILKAFADPPRRVIFPVHPRTRARLAEFEIPLPRGVTALEPLGYLEMIALERRALTIFTDSGGVQREAYFAGVPCVTLRDTTEWTNTVDAGWNRLAGADGAAIRQWLDEPPGTPTEHPLLFGDGHAAERIVEVLEAPQTAHIVSALRAARRART